MRKNNLFKREGLKGYIFLTPWLIGFCVFFAYPLIFSIFMSLSKIDVTHGFDLTWIGFVNYRKALIEDISYTPYLIESLTNSVINTPVVLVFSLFIAILLNQNMKGRGIYRALFLLPVLLGAGVVMQTLQGNGSIVGLVDPSQMGEAAQNATNAASANDMSAIKDIVLTDQLAMFLGKDLAEIVQIVLNQISKILWQSGIQIIIFLGALQAIPDTYYEAAACDGATSWEKFWKITLPMITPTILIIIVFTIIMDFTSTDNRVMKYVMDITFKDFNLTYGSALGWIYFLIIGIIIVIIFAVMKRVTYYADER